MRGIRSSMSSSKFHFVEQSASSTILHVGLSAHHLLIRILIAAVVVIRALVRDEEGGEEGEEAQARQGQEEPKKPGKAVWEVRFFLGGKWIIWDDFLTFTCKGRSPVTLFER